MVWKTDMLGGPCRPKRTAQGALQWQSHWSPCGRGRLGRRGVGGGKPEWLESRFGGRRAGGSGGGGGGGGGV